MGTRAKREYIAGRVAELLRHGEPAKGSYEAGELAMWQRLRRGRSCPLQTIATEYGRGELHALLAAMEMEMDRRLKA
jgi:hypothetical protein